MKVQTGQKMFKAGQSLGPASGIKEALKEDKAIA